MSLINLRIYQNELQNILWDENCFKACFCKSFCYKSLFFLSSQ